jgi:isomaltose glucohydrolase
MNPRPTTSATADAPLDLERLHRLARASHSVIAKHQQPGGAYPASPTFSAYRGYTWLRDGGFTAEGMSRYGDAPSADAFHDWVTGVLDSRSAQVGDLRARAAAGEALSHGDMLPTRFTFDGKDGNDDWWDFQTDGYGTWLWAVATHAQRHGLDLRRWRSGVEIATDYLAVSWHMPCYDWWEEHLEERHFSTLGAVYAGLVAAADSGILDEARTQTARDTAGQIQTLTRAQGLSDGVDRPEHLVKWVGNPAVDASLLACVVPFGLVPGTDPVASATLDAVRDDLDVNGGVHRFRADVFYGGGQWLLLSCLLGWNEAVRGERDRAVAHLNWVADHATPDDEFPEQVPGHLLHPEHRAEWIERWGTVATPLLWSHGMYLILADELSLLPGTESR